MRHGGEAQDSWEGSQAVEGRDCIRGIVATLKGHIWWELLLSMAQMLQQSHLSS